MELPEVYKKEMQALLEDEYTAYLDSFEMSGKIGIRVNTAKISVEDFVSRVPFALRPVPWVKNGFYVDSKEEATSHPYYAAGLYYVQEPSAMLPASRLPIEPGDRVLDLCAAPGGKATELAARLDGSGILVANDISNSRAKALLKNLELFGAGNIFVCSETPEKLLTRYEGYFDKILVDAPCSGEGMFRREPSMVRSWLEHGPSYYSELQRTIMDTAVSLLKPGGKILFSTCTFSPLENEGTVCFLLNRYPHLHLDEMERCDGHFAKGLPKDKLDRLLDDGQVHDNCDRCIRIFPHRTDGEGHFTALIGSDISAEQCAKETSSAKAAKNKIPEAWSDFADITLHKRFSEYRFMIQEDRLYALGMEDEVRKGIRYLRTGLYLGDIKKNRFEPSQALAMFLKKEDVRYTISLSPSDERVLRYLKGETIELTDEESGGLKGWCLICVDEFPLGWGKWAGSSLRNKYYAGWRRN